MHDIRKTSFSPQTVLQTLGEERKQHGCWCQNSQNRCLCCLIIAPSASQELTSALKHQSPSASPRWSARSARQSQIHYPARLANVCGLLPWGHFANAKLLCRLWKATLLFGPQAHRQPSSISWIQLQVADTAASLEGVLSYRTDWSDVHSQSEMIISLLLYLSS